MIGLRPLGIVLKGNPSNVSQTHPRLGLSMFRQRMFHSLYRECQSTPLRHSTRWATATGLAMELYLVEGWTADWSSGTALGVASDSSTEPESGSDVVDGLALEWALA